MSDGESTIIIGEETISALRRGEHVQVRGITILPASGLSEPNTEGSPLLEWAVFKWNDEVKNRPLVNIHRRSLDDAWRQVIRWAGGDPISLVGPSHDQLLAASEGKK
jgi:hypothetical protein